MLIYMSSLQGHCYINAKNKTGGSHILSVLGAIMMAILKKKYTSPKTNPTETIFWIFVYVFTLDENNNNNIDFPL